MKKEIVFLATVVILCVAIVSSCEKESKNNVVKTTTSEEPAPPPVITIGQNYGGGTVFYIDSTGKHGLIVSRSSLSQAIPWSNGEAIITNATGIPVGSGRENTTLIVNAQGGGSYAASICDRLDINGYDDWFLPSIDELQLLYDQKAAGTLHGIDDSFYWSSTEASETGAWSQSFSNGANSSAGKDGSYAVRAIRAF